MSCRHCGGRSLRRDYDGTARCLACGRQAARGEGCGGALPEPRQASGPWCGPPCKRVALAKRRGRQLAREASQGGP